MVDKEYWHNEGQKDAANSESTLLGETNRHIPFFGITEYECDEDREDYKEDGRNGPGE